MEHNIPTARSTPTKVNEVVGSPLLKLPPELRNRIYGYTLQEAGEISITPNLRQPPLVSTCRQIRNEALGLWVETNSFNITITDCDVSLIKAIGTLFDADVSLMRVRVIWQFHRNVPNWPLLVRWCQTRWSNGCGANMGLDEDGRADMQILHSAHETVSAAAEHGAPWEMCERQLRALRVVAGKLNPR